ncbi:MAG: regulatory protein RecX [Myxococcaceae bacterium]
MEASLRLLSVRARSRHELSSWLSRKGHPPAEVAAALSRLAELGYLDDQRFARDRALSLLREGRFGGGAVLQRLMAHGLTDEQAKRALAAAAAQQGFDPLLAARAVLAKRGLSGSLSAKERARAARLLHSRGFAEEVVEKLLGDPALETPPGDD